MHTASEYPVLCCRLSLAIATTVMAQDDNPHIGYVYPAGGQQGTTFEVLLGGQNLDGAFMARVSGDGVTAKVVEHIRPLNQGQFKEMQNRMGELQKKKEAAGKADRDVVVAAPSRRNRQDNGRPRTRRCSPRFANGWRRSPSADRRSPRWSRRSRCR